MQGPSGDHENFEGSAANQEHGHIGEMMVDNIFGQNNIQLLGTWEAAAIIVTPYVIVTCFILVGIAVTTVARWIGQIMEKITHDEL